MLVIVWRVMLWASSPQNTHKKKQIHECHWKSWRAVSLHNIIKQIPCLVKKQLFQLSFSALPRTRAPCVLVLYAFSMLSILSDTADLVELAHRAREFFLQLSHIAREICKLKQQCSNWDIKLSDSC